MTIAKQLINNKWQWELKREINKFENKKKSLNAAIKILGKGHTDAKKTLKQNLRNIGYEIEDLNELNNKLKEFNY